MYDQATETDHEVLQLMRAMPSASSSYCYRYGTKSRVTLEGRFGVQALEQAASTGRLFLDDKAAAPDAARRNGARRWTLRWHWHEVTRPQAAEPRLGVARQA